jgi:hypothetical protein
MTPLILLFCTTYVLSFTTALGSEVDHRSRAATILTVWSMVLLTGVVVADSLVDL